MGIKRDQAAVAKEIRNQDATWPEIADWLRDRWPELNARAAMRLAHGWSQHDVARKWNDRWPDEPKSAKNVSYWERWPQSGRPPKLDDIAKLAEVYECSAADLLTDIADFRHRDEKASRWGGIKRLVPMMGIPLGGEDRATSGVVPLENGSTDGLLGSPDDVAASNPVAPDLDGIEAVELMRRVEATDTGPGTLAAIATGVEGLCRSYTYMAPAELLVLLRRYQGYVARLLDGRATLAQRRELMSHAGWLSLLTATADMDVGWERPAAANFEVARSLAAEIGDASLAAWVLETQAWQALTNGDYARAAELCRAGLEIALHDTSAYVQLCTQLARVSARLGDGKNTHQLVDESVAAVDRTLADGQLRSGEHHFVCDRRRVVTFCAAALVWLGEGGSLTEEYARRAVAQYETDGADDGPWVHRLAVGRLNLALLLARNDQPTEAAYLGDLAFESSWRLCHTDLFLAADLDHVLTGRYRGDADVASFHDRYLDVRHRVGALG